MSVFHRFLVFFDATGTTDSSITGNTTPSRMYLHLELRRHRRFGDRRPGLWLEHGT